MASTVINPLTATDQTWSQVPFFKIKPVAAVPRTPAKTPAAESNRKGYLHLTSCCKASQSERPKIPLTCVGHAQQNPRVAWPNILQVPGRRRLSTELEYVSHIAEIATAARHCGAGQVCWMGRLPGGCCTGPTARKRPGPGRPSCSPPRPPPCARSPAASGTAPAPRSQSGQQHPHIGLATPRFKSPPLE